jgi:hypothetical protein
MSVKNAWIYASEFNDKMFSELSKTLKAEKVESGVVCLRYDMFTELKTNPHFILREPIFITTGNAECFEMNGIDAGKFLFSMQTDKPNVKWYLCIETER